MTERDTYSPTDFQQLERDLSRLPSGLDRMLSPKFREIESTFERGVDDEGVAYCMGNDGSTTRVVAVLLTDSDYPTRVPFTYRPFAVDSFLLRVPGPQLGAFFASYDGPETADTIRTIGGHFGTLQSEDIHFLASRPEVGKGTIEMGYDMTRAATAAKDTERLLAKKMGLFDPDKGLGFRPEHTRGILQVADGNRRHSILLKPDSFFTLWGNDTKENQRGRVPKFKDTQAVFRIKVDPLAPSSRR